MRHDLTRLTPITLAAALTCSATAGMTGFSFELHEYTAWNAPEGTYSIRLYAELDAGSRLNAVFATPEQPITLM